MKRHPYQWLWLLLALTLIFSAGSLRKSLVQQKVQENLTFQGDEAAPPELSIAMSLGLFRSVILDILWMRASSLQQENRFYEIVQLYDLIGKLQPHNARIWSYMGWNMAYNISVALPSAEERWRWVQNGLQRLIDNGLRYNPYDLDIYQETARIYGHKMGQNLDDAHLYYKTRLCEKVMNITGQEQFSANLCLDHLNKGSDQEKEAAQLAQTRLKKELGLDLSLMAQMELDPFFGPLDWRSPQVMCIYWCRLGLSKNRFKANIIPLERMIYQAQQHLLRQGSLVYMPASDFGPASLYIWPDYNQVLPMQKMFERQMEIFESQNAVSGGVRSAYRHFIDEALNILILAGQEELAQEMVRRATAKRPDFLPTSNAKDLMRQQMAEQLSSMSGDEYSALTASLLMRHFWWKGQGDERQSNSLLQYAELLWKTNAAKNSTGERSVNRSFKDLYLAVLVDIFRARLFHPTIANALQMSLDSDAQAFLESQLKANKTK